MTEYRNPHPTIGEAAKILGVSKRQMELLYLAGMTPAVRRDKLGWRRYPPIALQQAQRVLKRESTVGLKDKKKNVYLFVYLIGALIAWLTKPEIISALGVTLATLLLNYIFKVLDTQVSERFKGNKKGAVVAALTLISLLMGIATVYLAPKVSEYLQTNRVCVRLTESRGEACAYLSTNENSSEFDDNSPIGDTPASTPSAPSTQSPTEPPVNGAPTLGPTNHPANPSAIPPTSVTFTPTPTKQPHVNPSSTPIPKDPPPTPKPPTSHPKDPPPTVPTTPVPIPKLY